MKQRFRLKNTSDLKRVRRTGKSFAHPLVVLQVARSSDSDGLRIGIIASRAIGNAVNRNYAKRLLREAIRPQISNIQPGYDLVLVARHAVVVSNFKDLQFAVQQLLERANLMAGENVEKITPKS